MQHQVVPRRCWRQQEAEEGDAVQEAHFVEERYQGQARRSAHLLSRKVGMQRPLKQVVPRRYQGQCRAEGFVAPRAVSRRGDHCSAGQRA